MHDLKTRKSRRRQIRSHTLEISKILFAASPTKHKPLKKDAAACRFSNACKDTYFSAESNHLIPSQSRLKWISNRSLTPDWMELLHLAEWPGLSYHAEFQPGNPYVPHRQHDRRGEEHAFLPLMFGSPRAGVVVEREGIERWERYWICSTLVLPGLSSDIFFPSYLPWFLLLSFCWCACKNVVSVQVTVLAGLVVFSPSLI